MVKKFFEYFWRPVENIFLFDIEEIQTKVKWIYGLIIAFYGFTCFVNISMLDAGNWNHFNGLSNTFDPKWPIFLVFKLVNLDFSNLIKSIILFSAFTAALGLFYGIKFRFVRVILFLGLLIHVALINSFGKGSHSLYLALWCSFFLIFIPSLQKDRIVEYKKLFQIMFIIRTFILLTYFSSGFFKFYRLIEHSFADKMTALHKNGFSNLIAKDWYLTGRETILGPFVINHESNFWIVVLLSGYLIEILSIFVIFYPRVDKFWAIAILFMHIGIMLILGPNFVNHVFVVMVFLFFNVFSNTLREAIHQKFKL